MQNIPLFGSSATLTAPIASTVTSGYFPLQFLPAENLNYYLNATTQAVQELVNIITLAGNTPGASVQLWASISGILSTWKLNHFAATSSWELAQVISDETGSAANGLLVFNNGPTLIAPVLGAATMTTMNKMAITAPATISTLAISDGKTFTEKNTLTVQGTDGNVVDSDAIIRGVLYNGQLTISDTSTTTFTVGAGAVGDSTFVSTMFLSSALVKSTSAWAVGNNNGGLDTGAIGVSTLYYVYVIKRVDTQVVDVLFSTSSTSPTMPTNYTLKRLIGTVLTNSSSQFVALNAYNNGLETTYTPTFTGLGTVTAIQCTVRRSQNRLKGIFKFTLGTTTATEARISLPVGLLSDSGLITTISLCGKMEFNANSNGASTVLIEQGLNYVTIGLTNTAGGGLAKILGNALVTGTICSLFLDLPILGWNAL